MPETRDKTNLLLFSPKTCSLPSLCDDLSPNVPPTDHQLLKLHQSDPSGNAFGQLVDRYLGLVHSVARRVTNNDEAARDISQTVFLRLAKKAPDIPETLPLTAWFHRETHSASVDHVRSEVRRQKREEISATLDTMNADSCQWDEIAPEIDDALNELEEEDRALVLFRFYENKSHPEIGRALGISQDAARMRTRRALDKLKSSLGKRGITTTAAILGTSLSANAITAPPAGLAATISATAGAAAPLGLLGLAKANLIALGTLAVAIPVIVTQQVKIQDLSSSEPRQELSTPTATSSNSERTTSSTRTTSREPEDLLAIFSNPDPTDRIASLHNFALRIDPAAIPAALDLLHQKTPEWDREANMLSHLLLAKWVKHDPEAAFASLDVADFTKMRGHTTSILSALAAYDPKRAADWLGEPGNAFGFYPKLGHILAGTIAREWARQDLDSALAWAKELPTQQQAGAYTGILKPLASVDPEQASSLALSLEDSDTRQYLLSEIAEAWALSAPLDTLTWADSLPSQDRKEATLSALYTWAQDQPQEVASYLDSQPEVQANFLPLVSDSWSRRQPLKAADWIVSKPDSSQRNTAIRKAFWNWTTQNPSSAADWIDGQASGSARNHAIAGFTTAAAEFNPPTALEWTGKISNPELRSDLRTRILDSWSHRDPEAAAAWRKNHPVISTK